MTTLKRMQQQLTSPLQCISMNLENGISDTHKAKAVMLPDGITILQPPLVLRVFCTQTKVAFSYLFTLSSHKIGRCSNISSGSVSAAMTINSAMPRLRHLVAATNLRHFHYRKVSKVWPLITSTSSKLSIC